MTTTPLPYPFQPDQDALEWLAGRTVDELKAIEIVEPDNPIPTLLFPEAIRHRDARGAVKEFPVLLKIPRDADNVSATIAAVGWVAKKFGEATCKTPARARELLGSEGYFTHLEQSATLCICLRQVKPPHPPAFLLDIFLQTFEAGSIRDIWERAETLSSIFNPRLGTITEAQFWKLAAEVARVRNVTPLFALAQGSLSDFITRAAAAAMLSRTPVSSSGSSNN